MFSKREYKRKKIEEQEAAAHVFQDFIETFQSPSVSVVNKTFVKSATLNPDSEEPDESIGKIYKPKPVVTYIQQSESNKAIEYAKILKDQDKTKKREKPKSNLDLLKEELKLRHTEREERDKLKDDVNLGPVKTEGDEQGTTNLFIANLKTTVTENNLMLEFGAYGPLASVKILWPRGDECNNRNTNCGFVAFMSRKDAERALKENQHREDMRVCWGRSVELPSFPVYIPNSLLKLYLPPPISGLPFNAQPTTKDKIVSKDTIAYSYVKVTIPFNKKILMLIHRMIEFVVTEGPMFEAFIMNREINNPDYNFLFDFQSPAHVYYRWKLFSILHGDSKNVWSTKKFRMFKNGSIWCPPMIPCYTAGMPDELIVSKVTDKKNKLTESQCERLIALLRNLTMQKSSVKEAMVFCMHRLESINDSIEIILDSLSNPETVPTKKIARLYLLSDVLSNCQTKRIKLEIETTLLQVAQSLQTKAETLNHSDREKFVSRIMRVIRYWDIYKMFPEEFIDKLSCTFANDKPKDDDDHSDIVDEPLDGANLLKRSGNNESSDPNVVTAKSLSAKKQDVDIRKYFVPSKWDTIDPDEVEAQAMSTEKMYLMELDKGSDVEMRKSKSKKKKKKSKH